MIDEPSPGQGRPAAPWLSRLPAGAPLVLLALLLAAMAVLCIALVSSTRAYVGGESQWSKGQKSATLALLRYIETRDESDWQRYEQAIAVPLGDRRAREELERADPDLAQVRDGFLRGDNHVDDLDGMIRLFRWFRRVPFMDQAIRIWAEADGLIAQVEQVAAELRTAVRAGAGTAELQALRQRVLVLDEQLTPLAHRFSATLGEAARTTQAWLTGAVLSVSLVLATLAMAAMRHAQRRAEQQAAALRDSEARRARALVGSSDGFWEWDLRRGVAYFSPRFESLIGHAPGALVPDVAAVKALHHPDDVAKARRALKDHLEQGLPYDVELRLRHVDGGWRWMRSRARVDRGPDGRELRLSGSISDVTERRAAEEALRRSEAMFRSLWETTGDAVLIVDTTRHIRFANASAHTMFGYAAGTLAGRPLAVLQPAGLDWRASEVAGRHADGHEIPLEIRFSEFELDGSHHVVGFLRDITARKQAERALRDANERLEARVQERTRELTEANEQLREVDRLKSEFLASMSHELRTPLNAILGFSSLLLADRTTPPTESQRRSLGFVHGAGQHLLALINDLLDLSRIESGRMALSLEPVDAVEVVTEVTSLLQPAAAAKGLALAQSLPAALPLQADRRKLYQVLLNLVNNAIKFTPAGAVQVQAALVDGGLRIEVRDTGIGIAPEQLPTLFQPFRQLDASLRRVHEGAGLGLYLCRRLLDLMGGRIEVRSTPGVGSCFTVWLPADGRG